MVAGTHLLLPETPCSNGQAENLVIAVENDISVSQFSTPHEFKKCVQNSLLQYRNYCHSTTHENPFKLFEVTFYRCNDLGRSSILILKNLGEQMYRILDTDDLSVYPRHVDQMLSGESNMDDAQKNSSEIRNSVRF